MTSESAEHDAAALLRRARRGDAAAARALLRAAAPGAAAAARSVLRDAALADDAVQEAFVKLLGLGGRAARRIDDPHAWLRRAARNEALMIVRTNRRRQARELASADQPSSRRVPDAWADVRRAVDALPDDLREIVVLRHMGGLSFAQAAAIVGIGSSTAAERYQRALDALRMRLDPEPMAMHASTSQSPGGRHGRMIGGGDD